MTLGRPRRRKRKDAPKEDACMVSGSTFDSIDWEPDTVPCSHPSKNTIECGGLIFSSAFDSGNLLDVQAVGDDEFRIANVPDNHHLDVEGGCRYWWHFKVLRGKPSRTICITVCDLPCCKMFRLDYRPVTRSFPRAPHWVRIPNKVTMKHTESRIEMTFSHTFAHGEAAVYFAFSYPYPYCNLLRAMSEWEDRAQQLGKVYFRRELLCMSLERRRVDLLIITETATGGPPTVTLDLMSRATLPAFPGRRSVLVSGRVHPGETPASHIVHGMVDFLLSSDPRATLLRRHFVFFIVPVLNPDGVEHGMSRADTQGVNLNREYRSPCPAKHPTIFAVCKLFDALHKECNLTLFIDFHSHVNKRGVFMYGNAMDAAQHVSNLLFPKLVSINTPYFDFAACNFTTANMSSSKGGGKEGTSRVSFFQRSNLVHCYTCEANFDSGQVGSIPSIASSNPHLQSCVAEPDRLAASANSPARFNIPVFHDVSKGIAVSILDLFSLCPQPFSRVACTKWKSTSGVRQWVMQSLIDAQKAAHDSDRSSSFLPPTDAPHRTFAVAQKKLWARGQAPRPPLPPLTITRDIPKKLRVTPPTEAVVLPLEVRGVTPVPPPIAPRLASGPR